MIPADDERGYEGTHIRFEHRATGPKTMVWSVLAKENEGYLGRVCWFGGWRKYGFYPEGGVVFEEVCMREIADFLVARTKEHRLRRALTTP